MKTRIDIPQKVEDLREDVQEIKDIVENTTENIQEVSEDVQELIESTEALSKEVRSLWESIKDFLIKIVYGIKDGTVAVIKFFKNLFKKKD